MILLFNASFILIINFGKKLIKNNLLLKFAEILIPFSMHFYLKLIKFQYKFKFFKHFFLILCSDE